MSILYNYIRKNHILAIVEDAAENHKRRINLSYFEIDKIPKGLFDCHHVEKVYLHRNKIKELEGDFVQLVNITTLTIDYNSLTCLPPEIGHLVNLQNLNVSHNPLKKIPPEISLLRRLEVLWCNSIDAESLPEELGDLVCLDTFGARGNKIRQLPASFTNLKNLRWLTLENNLLNKLPADVNRLECLVHLNVKRNQLTDVPRNLFKCRRIQYLFLGDNQIENISLAGKNKLDLSCIKRLVYVDVRDNPFVNTKSFTDNIKHFPELRLDDKWKRTDQQPNNEIQPGTSGHNANIQRDTGPAQSDDDDSSISSSDDWQNSYPSSQIDSTDHSDEDILENEAVGNYLPELSRFVGTGS